MRKKESSWKKSMKRSFLSGILLVGPLFATGYVLYLLFKITDNLLQPILTQYLNAHIPGLGILVTILLVFFIGLITRNFLAQRIIRLGERILARIPLAGSVYGSIKQIVRSFSNDEEQEAKKVVIVPWPSEGLWAFGFLNGELVLDGGRNMGLVLVLSSINPTTGLLTMVPIEKIKQVDISVDEAMKIIISGGIVSPDYLNTRPLIAIN